MTTNQTVEIDESNRALDADKQYKFKYPSGNFSSGGSFSWLNVTNEHVMVWFQMESFPTFNKLWGHITGTLVANQTYKFIISNHFNVTQFEGKKYIYLSEVNKLGGKNNFLGLAYIIVAGVILLFMVLFCFMYCIRICGKDIYSTENL